MTSFFLLLEIFLYSFSAYIFYTKKELAIVYLPVLFFANAVLTVHVISAFVYYATISFLMLYFILKNTSFFKQNMFSLFIFLYFLILMSESKDLESIRPSLFNVMWLFLLLPLIHSIYRKYNRTDIFNELATSATIILTVFIANVLLSTVLKYDVHSMYGITTGVLYGNLMATDFNILSIAVFIVLLNVINTQNVVRLIIAIIALAFIVLSLRRSVIGVGAVAIVFVLLVLANENIKKIITYGSVMCLIGFVIISKTDFVSEFNDRYSLRQLDTRDLDSEGRFVEYELLYKDMFVKNKYSPWFGFQLFNSSGNYGDGIFGERTLHGDLTSITHSSGFIGLGLYLLMIATFFYKSYKAHRTKLDKLIILFGLITLVTYTLTGRYTEIGSMLLLFLVVGLPYSESEEYVSEMEEVEELEGNYAL